MSYYYNYYVGYMFGGKMYPWGPYTAKGEIVPVLSISRSFASDLHEDFWRVEDEMLSDELRKEFEYDDWNGEKRVDVKYLNVKELPHGSYIRKGYYLIEDVKAFEADEDGDFDGFYDSVNPTVYVVMLDNEIKFGKPKRMKDDYGEWYYPKSASDYMYYAYPDYNSREYEAFILRFVVEAMRDYNLPKDTEYVILETEG